jgi:SAM-dependent methyltransferase
MTVVENSLQVLSQLHADYIRNFDRLNKVRAENDFMAGENYFDVGRSAIAAIVAGLLSAGIGYPKKILDLACGNGRVTRHLALIFPDSEITACDLYPEMVEFCVRTFNVRGAVSTEDLAELILPDQFDLIWCGSLLTHCNQRLFDGGLQAMRRALATPAVAVCTVHGRRAVALQRYVWKMCSDELFRPAERSFYRTGFGIADTFDERAKGLFPLNASLGGGQSLSSMSYVCDKISEMEDACLLYYREMGWNGHQDVVAFGKPGVFPSQ